MKWKQGFTLIELLAVIVILAVIALIATPLVLNIIERAEKGAFKDGVYGIMEAAEFQVILDDSKYPITYVLPEDSERIQFKGTKPTEGYLQIVSEGKIKLALGNGRWCAVKDVNEFQVTVNNGHCEKIDLNRPIISGYGDLNQEIDLNASYTLPNVTATDKDGNTLTVTTTIKQGDNVVDNIDTSKAGSYTITYTTEPDKDGNTSTVTVTIQIIKKETDTDKVIENGTKDGGLELIDGTYYYRGENPKNWIQFNEVTGDDSLWRIISIENGLIKIIRFTPITGQAWDQSGSNDWTRPATINTYLNEMYYETLQAVETKIETGSFYIGTVTYGRYAGADNSARTLKKAEREKVWQGKIGLINPTDYAYVSGSSECMDSIFDFTCYKNNWLYVLFGNLNSWTMNASSFSSDSAIYFLGHSLYDDNGNYVMHNTLSLHPVLFLKSNIQITSGDGSQDNPYQI